MSLFGFSKRLDHFFNCLPAIGTGIVDRGQVVESVEDDAIFLGDADLGFCFLRHSEARDYDKKCDDY